MKLRLRMQKLQAQGHLTAADQRLQSLGNQPDILLLRADWQAAAKNDVRALALYDAVLQQQPKNASPAWKSQCVDFDGAVYCCK